MRRGSKEAGWEEEGQGQLLAFLFMGHLFESTMGHRLAALHPPLFYQGMCVCGGCASARLAVMTTDRSNTPTHHLLLMHQ